MKPLYPVLESVMPEDMSLVADLLGITALALKKRRYGKESWLLDEAFLLRDNYAPHLTVEELFYLVPPLRQRQDVEEITEAEMLGGFNPALYASCDANN